MARALSVALASALLVALPTATLAKNLCIQIDTGVNPGSVLFLKGVQLGKRKFGPVQGYHAKFEIGFQQFFPVDGQSIVASNGNVVLGITVHEMALGDAADIQPFPRLFAINLGCSPGADRKIGVQDACVGHAFETAATAHVIDCADAPLLP